MGVKLYQLQQSRDGEAKENLSQDAAEMVSRIKDRSATSSNPTLTSLASFDSGTRLEMNINYPFLFVRNGKETNNFFCCPDQ